MKTDFLKNLGIVDQAVIDAIMAENGRDVNHARKESEELTSQVAGLQKQLDERDEQLKGLKKSVKDNESLTAKISELEDANAKMKGDYEDQLTALRRDNEIEGKLRTAKARNIAAVKALLKDGEDVDAQIKALQESEDTSFLFGEDAPKPTPAGTNPSSGNPTPPANTELSFADRIGRALHK